MRAGNTREVSPWLRQAAAQPRTFYGLIATRALGWDFDFNWDMPRLTATHKELLESLPAARRAMALVSAGQYHLAEDELHRINPGSNAVLREALLAYAHDAGLPSFAMRLAESTPAPDGDLYDAALYPLVPWQPAGGFEVDRALILAIIRQESRFDTAARSGRGATGLMQLMPTTASFVAQDSKYKEKNGRHSLHDPETNMAIGQRYIADLLGQDAVKADLFSLAIAYNAGPGNLRKWKNQLSEMQDDPLLFVESIPVGETRAFVERVLANYWIYSLRMNQKTPSLDAVAAGDYARYVSMDKDLTPRKPFRLASN
jgi:soluble lytic murein transglycosylase-like protein